VDRGTGGSRGSWNVRVGPSLMALPAGGTQSGYTPSHDAAGLVGEANANYRSSEIDWQLMSPMTSVRGVDDVDTGRLDVIAQLRSSP
jgi:hypothetical protein